jgi:hypothetical protein
LRYAALVLTLAWPAPGLAGFARVVAVQLADADAGPPSACAMQALTTSRLIWPCANNRSTTRWTLTALAFHSVSVPLGSHVLSSETTMLKSSVYPLSGMPATTHAAWPASLHLRRSLFLQMAANEEAVAFLFDDGAYAGMADDDSG